MTGVHVRPASSDEDWTYVETLFREYLASLDFAVTFQDVDREFASLRREYGPPEGQALLAYAAADLDGVAGAVSAAGAGGAGAPVGAVGVRRFADGVAELKRMYVRPVARGRRVGHSLGAAAIAAARDLGYSALRLDTVADMTAAIAVYESLGFLPIPAYRHNPLPSARYFEIDLRA